MDGLTRSYYEVVFERDFLLKKGDEFQNFFCDIMGKCHPGDFLRVRPWGQQGDRKNDGYLRSQRMLFQVYAPNEMRAADAISKIEKDFQGALPHWEEYFGAWTFVHNSRSGLGPEVAEKLLSLAKQYPNIAITDWGFECLRRKLFSMCDSDIASVLGPALTPKHVLNIGFEDIRVVLDAIRSQDGLPDTIIQPVSPRKLEANALSKDVGALLRAGMGKAYLVDRFFATYYDPSYGDRVAAAFRNKYLELREERLIPNEIFTRLLVFAGGERRGTPEHEAAVLAVLANLFEKCDIFENARDGD